MTFTVSGTNGLTFPDATTMTTGSQATRAWVYFNGTAGSIYASYNVSSITHSTTGVYIVNFSSALTDANYTFAGSLTGPNGMPINLYIDSGSNGGTPTTKSTTQCQLRSTSSGGSSDCSYISAIFNR